MDKRKRRSLPTNVDNDNTYDEIDRFHMEKDAKTLNFMTHKQKTRKKEILSVRVDEDIDYEDQQFDKTPAEINETTNKWGRKRSNFYGTSYVDKDFGGVNDSEEEEILDLEEKDAIQRQKRQDATLVYANLDDFDKGGESGEDEPLDFRVERSDDEDEEEVRAAQKLAKKKKRKAAEDSSSKKEKRARTMKDDELTIVVEDRNAESKRAITKEIMKNKGLTVKRRKDSKHARIKNRKLYDKALIRRRSQVPDVRRELTKYDGEKRGIRASTIRSIKLQ